MEVEIISRECIKSSSSTPLHLKTYKLSLLDQCFRQISYAPIILHYPVSHDMNLSGSINVHHTISIKLQLLKHSLSATLARFYPFAGKFKDNFSVDCSDEGIYFIEARIKSSLNEFLNQPNHSFIGKFIPSDANEQDGGPVSGRHVAKVQVTTFACGGLVICASTHHEFGDATTTALFLKSWAATTCGKNEEAVIPNIDASSLFPQNDAFPREATWAATHTPFLKYGRFVTRRFVFDAKAIATIKAKVTNSCVKNSTRAMVVSALISKCIMNAFKTNNYVVDMHHEKSHEATILTHVVDLRQKTTPLRPKCSIGNIVWLENVLVTDEQDELDSIVCEVTKAIKKVNGDFVKSLQGDRGFINLCEAIKDQSRACASAANKIIFSSCCNMGLYDIDFGWGKPIWVSFSMLDGQVCNSTNSIILSDTRLAKNGIEAWINLVEEDMNILEHDQELLAVATINPSPLGLKRRLAISCL